MKNFRRHILAALAALLISTVAAEARRDNFVRYNVDTELEASDVVPHATGRVQAFLRKQGNSDNRRLRVRVANLEPEATFTLRAIVGDSTVDIQIFTTDSRGRATLVYVENSSTRRANAPRKSKHVLPEELSDLTTIRALVVVNANDEVVLSADLHGSETLSYQVATALHNTGNDPDAIGVMAAAVQHGTIQFRLFAMGQSSQYTLVINDEPIANYAADFTGGIAVGAYPSRAPLPMELRQISLKNAADVVILESQVR